MTFANATTSNSSLLVTLSSADPGDPEDPYFTTASRFFATRHPDPSLEHCQGIVLTEELHVRAICVELRSE